jgi:hypothetical protein
MEMLTVVSKAQSLRIGAATIARLAAQVLRDLFNHVLRYCRFQRLTYAATAATVLSRSGRRCLRSLKRM